MRADLCKRCQHDIAFGICNVYGFLKMDSWSGKRQFVSNHTNTRCVSMFCLLTKSSKDFSTL